MRILYLHQYFTTPDGSGGTRSFEFARRLIAAGHNVCVITSGAFLPEHYRQSSQLVSETEIDGIPLVVIDVPYDNKMSFDQRIDAFLRFAVLATREAMSRSADVVFATSTPLSIAIPGLFAALKQRIPLVFEVRDLWPELPIAMGALRNPAACVVARLLEWLAYHGSAHVVALSPGMAEGVVSRGIAPGRVTVIPNSCDTDSFEVPPEYGHTFRSKLPDLAPEQPLVVYTGTFGQINGVGYLVAVAEAMQRIDPSVRFLLVGAGAEKEQVTEEARACGVFGKNLWIWDSIPKTQMPSLLSASTVATSLFIPLRPMWNNSANKFFDALAAGRPVAINYGGWQAELLQESGAGLVLPPGDPVAGAHTLAAFLHNPEALHKARAAARDLAHNQFQRDGMAQKLERVLRNASAIHPLRALLLSRR